MLDITKKNASVKLTKPFMKGEDGGYYWPEWNDEGQLIWQASEDGMPIIPPFDVKGEDGGYYTPITDENGELNWVPSNENMPAVTGASLATKEYVDEAVKDVDLSEYAKKTDIPDVSGLATKAEIPSLEGYAKTADIPDTSGLATEDYVDEKFNSIEIPEGQSGVYVGEEEPTDDSVVWINPEGDGTTLEQLVKDAVNLDAYALKADIPDTSGFTTEAQVNSLINTALGVIENGTY